MAEAEPDEKEKIDGLSHPEVMSLFSEKLAEIMSDPLLIGLPSEPTLEEVNSQIALEHGRAIVVNVRQHDEMNTVLRKHQDSVVLEKRKVEVFKGSKGSRTIGVMATIATLLQR